MAGKGKGFATRAIHAGERYDAGTGAVGTPIYQTSTFYHPEKPDGRGGWVPNEEFIYSRFANPTVRAVEEKLASLEGAEDALCFASGMGAISATCLSLVRPGEDIVAQANVYGGTTSLLNHELTRLGVTTHYSFEGTADTLADLVTEKTRAVMVEAPSNPFGFIVDLPLLRRRLEKEWGAKRPRILMDATLASPYNFQSLTHGADLVLHSATKYLNGHSDIIAGCVAGPKALIEPIRPWLRSIGASMDPHQAFLLRRGIATLAVRMERHNSSAAEIAQALSGHPSVERVWHPSLPDHPDHKLGRRLMRGFGSILALQLRTRDVAAARAFLRRLNLFAVAASLGGVESLASLPVDNQHARTSLEVRRKLGITDTLVRLAVGLEDPADLLDDLRKALPPAPAARGRPKI